LSLVRHRALTLAMILHDGEVFLPQELNMGDDGLSQPRRKSRLNQGRESDTVGWDVIGPMKKATSLSGDHHLFSTEGRTAKGSAGR